MLPTFTDRPEPKRNSVDDLLSNLTENKPKPSGVDDLLDELAPPPKPVSIKLKTEAYSYRPPRKGQIP